jgi:hypothetical protein
VGIVAFNATDFVVFALFPKFVAFLNDPRIRKNMAVTAEELGLRDIRLRKLGQHLPFLVRP